MRTDREKTLTLFCQSGDHSWERTVKRVSANQPLNCPDHTDGPVEYAPMDVASGNADQVNPIVGVTDSTKVDVADLVTRVAANSKKERLVVFRLTPQDHADVVDLLKQQKQAKYHQIAARM